MVRVIFIRGLLAVQIRLKITVRRCRATRISHHATTSGIRRLTGFPGPATRKPGRAGPGNASTVPRPATARGNTPDWCGRVLRREIPAGPVKSPGAAVDPQVVAEL